MTKAVPVGRRGERGVLAVGWALHQAEEFIERTITSPWPASRDTASRVIMSPMPGRSTFVPNREKKPSAAGPQRALAWERS
jgi:hypothetical protein